MLQYSGGAPSGSCVVGDIFSDDRIGADHAIGSDPNFADDNGTSEDHSVIANLGVVTILPITDAGTAEGYVLKYPHPFAEFDTLSDNDSNGMF